MAKVNREILNLIALGDIEVTSMEDQALRISATAVMVKW